VAVYFVLGEGAIYDASSIGLQCFGKDLEGSGLIEVLSWNLSEGTGENHKHPQSE
jgi:hypothetical protein